MRHRQLEKAGRERLLRLRSCAEDREIAVVVELAVGRVGLDADRRHVVRHHHGYRRRHHIGRVGADHQVDLVDLDELRVDRRHVGGVALVVVENQLDRPAEEPAFLVDIVAPDLQRGQNLLAGQGDAPVKAMLKPSLIGSAAGAAADQHRATAANAVATARNAAAIVILPCISVPPLIACGWSWAASFLLLPMTRTARQG